MSSGIVMTVATPDYAKKWAFCIDAQRAYCQRLGYEYQIYSDSIDGLHPKWSKLQYTIDALAKDVPVMLIDADAEIVENAPPFHTLLDAHPQGDILFTNGVSGRLNSGVMIFRPGADSVATAYLQTSLDRRNVPVAAEHFVTAEGENGHLIAIMAEEPFVSRAGILGREWNCTSPECYAGAHVRHYTGPLRQAANAGTLVPPPVGFQKDVPKKKGGSGVKGFVKSLLGR